MTRNPFRPRYEVASSPLYDGATKCLSIVCWLVFAVDAALIARWLLQ